MPRATTFPNTTIRWLLRDHDFIKERAAVILGRSVPRRSELVVVFPLLSLSVFALDAIALLGALCFVEWFQSEPSTVFYLGNIVVALVAGSVFLVTCWKRLGYDASNVLGTASLVRSGQIPLLASGLIALACSVLLNRLPAALLWSVTWTSVAGGLVLVFRCATAALVAQARSRGWLQQRVAVADLDGASQGFTRKVSATHQGLADLVHTTPGPNQDQLDELIALSRALPVRSIIITGAGGVVDLDDVRARLRSVVSDVYVAVPSDAAASVRVRNVGDWELRPLMLRPLTFWQRTQKLVFDKVVSLILLGFLSPVFVGVALAVKMNSPGPIFFKQPRVGFNNVSFTMFKFRSMYHDQQDLLCGRQTSRDDPRVTPVGKIIRRLSLDEIPQILNVLLGDMSLVGPRPHAPSTQTGGMLLEDLVPTYAERHVVRPGLTGLAQVSGARGEVRSSEQIERRVSLDLAYIGQWSLWLDVKILWLTLAKEFVNSRAY